MPSHLHDERTLYEILRLRRETKTSLGFIRMEINQNKTTNNE
jgi:hypothetical protein